MCHALEMLYMWYKQGKATLQWIKSSMVKLRCLRRLKQQLMSEQEDEEEKVRWRVEAEVKLALQETQAAQAQQGLHNSGLL